MGAFTRICTASEWTSREQAKAGAVVGVPDWHGRCQDGRLLRSGNSAPASAGAWDEGDAITARPTGTGSLAKRAAELEGQLGAS